jgi:hypothetical protein
MSVGMVSNDFLPQAGQVISDWATAAFSEIDRTALLSLLCASIPFSNCDGELHCVKKTKIREAAKRFENKETNCFMSISKNIIQ